MNLSKPVRAFISAAIGTALAACSQGPGETELAQACIAGSHPALVSEAMCKCFAREAMTNASPQVRQAMLLQMQGKSQESVAVLGDLSFEQRAELGVQQLEMLAKCENEG